MVELLEKEDVVCEGGELEEREARESFDEAPAWGLCTTKCCR